jgi:hypothetical protein
MYTLKNLTTILNELMQGDSPLVTKKEKYKITKFGFKMLSYYEQALKKGLAKTTAIYTDQEQELNQLPVWTEEELLRLQESSDNA